MDFEAMQLPGNVSTDVNVGISTRDSPRSRSRGDDGRFCNSTEGLTDLSEQNAKKKLSRDECRTVGKGMFEELLDALFLVGERSDCVLATSSGQTGYACIVEQLFKRKYHVPPLAQYQLTRTRYYSGSVTKNADNLPRMFVTDVIEKRRRVRVFRGRRFPRATRQSTDMKSVWAWIANAKTRNILKTTDQNQVYETIREALDQYSIVEKRIKIQHPSRNGDTDQPEDDSAGDSPSESTPVHPEAGDVVLERRQVEETPSAEGRVLREEVSNRRSETTSRSDEYEEMSESPVFYPSLSRLDNTLLHMVDKVIETARNDKLFQFLCKVDEESSECKIDLVAGRLLQKIKKEGTKVSALVIDVLQYGHGKHCGVSDISAHQALRERIRKNVEMLKLARELLGLKPFEQMRWRAQRESCLVSSPMLLSSSDMDGPRTDSPGSVAGVPMLMAPSSSETESPGTDSPRSFADVPMLLASSATEIGTPSTSSPITVANICN